MKKILPVTFCLLLLLPAAASAVKLYKWVDKDGNVTYQEFPPPASAGKVEEKDINPDTNVIHTEQPAPGATQSRGSSAGGGQQESGDGTDSAAPAPATVLQEGDQPESPGSNPLPAKTPPNVLTPPAPLAPPPVQAPPPVLPPPPALPPPPPGGAR